MKVFRNISLLLLVTLSVGSCKFQLYTKQDVTSKKADVKIDEAPHFKNSLEWWYFTGHLQDSSQQKNLGIEYVFFHFNPTKLKSYLMVNMAVSDPESEAFYYDYKMIPIKGNLKQELPLNISINKKLSANLKGANGDYELRGRMEAHNVAINLKTNKSKEVVLHDGVGYESYGDIATAGYFSFPRLNASGNIMIKNQEYLVKGELWYDRQWNCSGVLNENVAWDWFSVQFKETESELMIYRVYNLLNQQEILGGTYTDSIGNSTYLNGDEISIKETEYWKSTKSDTQYPIAWTVSLPSLKLETQLKAEIPHQELALKFWPINFYYWEGMCKAQGSIDGKQVTGNSYVEMTNRFRDKK